MKVTSDVWYDLVFHTLACTPADADDASCLYEFRYLRWVEARWSVGVDAHARAFEELASLLARSAKGFLLQSFALLWTDVSAFQSHRDIEFARIDWPAPESCAAAQAICDLVHPDAVRLFRRLLLDQLQAGFVDYWFKAISPVAHEYRQTFLRLMTELAQREPGLLEADWVLSFPLGQRGRLMSLRSNRPKICIGVGAAELGVPETHPVIQACHEFMLAATTSAELVASALGTVPGQAGYERFLKIEGEASRRASNFFADGPWSREYAAWLSR